MKKVSLIIVIFSMLSCTNKIASEKKENNIVINDKVLVGYSHDAHQMIIISCNSCSCFKTVMKDLTKNELDYLSKISVLTDTSCFKLNFPAIHISQKQIDSISYDIFNVTLIKSESRGYVSRTIETDESKRFIEITKSFFDSH